MLKIKGESPNSEAMVKSKEELGSSMICCEIVSQKLQKSPRKAERNLVVDDGTIYRKR